MNWLSLRLKKLASNKDVLAFGHTGGKNMRLTKRRQPKAYIIEAETMSLRTLSTVINHLLDHQVIFSGAQENRGPEVRA